MDLAEKVARAIAEKYWGDDAKLHEYCLPAARAAIAVCAEEMAKVAENRGEQYQQPTQYHYDKREGCYDAAAAIRSMGEKGE